jgi:hypothetical protein
VGLSEKSSEGKMTSAIAILSLVSVLFLSTSTLAQTFPVAGALPYRESPACQGELGFLGYREAGVDTILKFAGITGQDVVYDVGLNAAEILVAAARTVGARGIGFPLCPKAHAHALQSAQAVGVTSKVKFMTTDFLEGDYREATVVVLTLIPQYNERLMPKLATDLKPGARVVSPFPMGKACPDSTLPKATIPGNTVRMWTVPFKTDC